MVANEYSGMMHCFRCEEITTVVGSRTYDDCVYWRCMDCGKIILVSQNSHYKKVVPFNREAEQEAKVGKIIWVIEK